MKQDQFDMIAKTLFGLEQVLENELKFLGATSVKQGVRNVRFRGDTGFLYKANLCCRTALRILKPIYFDKVKTADSYYHSLSRLPWEEYMNIDTRFSIQVTQSVPMFRNTMFAAQRAKDALVDRFRKRVGKRPDVGREDPDITFFIHLSPKGMEVSLDSSGKPLNQRGYRTETNIAPINEVLAAGLVTLSGWKHTSPFLDPMCGSGTLLIEAAMQACNIPSQINRKQFAFEKLNDYDADLFLTIREAMLNRVKECFVPLVGYDKAPSAVRKAQQNIEAANLSDYISIQRRDFFKTKKDTLEQHLHVLTNPPYGERLAVDADVFYKQMGDTFKQNYPNTDVWMITASLEGLKNFGLRTSRKIKLFNGKLESRLVCYPIFERPSRELSQDSVHS
ncbi:MAG: THUMP domain-containing protein [Flavobacteriaceae bacterium]|nr:THUMP domain-containing protein [Flavobacteriaceae bacterium]